MLLLVKGKNNVILFSQEINSLKEISLLMDSWEKPFSTVEILDTIKTYKYTQTTKQYIPYLHVKGEVYPE